MKRIRIGIVGAGGMTAYHIPGFRNAGGAGGGGEAHADHRRGLRIGEKWPPREGLMR